MVGDWIEFTSTFDMFTQLRHMPVAVVGMIKPAGGDVDGIDFSLRDCEHWVPVPGSLIDRYQPLGKVRCGDHQHDFVRLHLKRLDDEAGAALADLLSLHHGSADWTSLSDPTMPGVRAA